MDPKKKETPEKISEAERKKQNQDFPNIPAASEKQSPPDIKKNDIKKLSAENETGKTDNTETTEQSGE